MNPESSQYPSSRKLGPNEFFFSKSPYSVITMLARIRGSISESELKEALEKLQQRHIPLRYRVIPDEMDLSWFTTEGTGEIPYKIIARPGPQDWIKAVRETSQVPFQFKSDPAIKVILLQSSQTSELVILCHHVLADGMSLAYLTRDLLQVLGEPSTTLPALPAPEPLSLENMPGDVKQSGIAKFAMKRINKKWEEARIDFEQADYETISEAYWSNYDHPMQVIELTDSETEQLINRCRSEKVSVNSALTSAFIGAASSVIGEKGSQSRTVVAADLRDRIPDPPGEGLGVYAGGLDFKFEYNHGLDFWDNARHFHKQASPLYTNKNLFKEVLTWSYLHPTLSEAMTFKKLGSLVPPESGSHEKLFSFSQQEDVVKSILKREKLEDFENIFLGTAITNLTRLDFPTTYGDLELERLIFKPGGAFPLSNIHLLVGAVTCSGKLSLTLEYSNRNFNEDQIQSVRERALALLLPG